MRLRNWTSAPLHPPDESFEILREVVAVADPSTPVTARSRALFASSHLRCQRGGERHSGERCLACVRLVSILPSRAQRTVTVRCLWTGDDPVTGFMTTVERMPSVEPGASLAKAASIARFEEVHHLVVIEDGTIVGATCECALCGDGLVGERMIPHVWTIPISATLGAAAQAMIELEVGLLVVVERRLVHGIVTASDLHLELPAHVH